MEWSGADSAARHFGVAASGERRRWRVRRRLTALTTATTTTRRQRKERESRPLARAPADMLGLGTAGSFAVVPRRAATTIASWPSTLLLTLLCFLCQWTVAKADIRCHCNLAPCVSTGYMCKSELGLCFSESVQMTSSALNPAATTAPRHGCVDLLADVADEVNYGCKEPDGASSPILEAPLSSEGRQCCSDDMCNFQRDFQEPGASESRTRGGGEQHASSLTRLVWFRAAVIAVPIAGGSVLVLLVLLAARLLRKDSELPSTASANFHEALHKGRHRGLLRACIRRCCCLNGDGAANATDKGAVVLV